MLNCQHKMRDLHHLVRFIEAQEPVYQQALTELASGQKQSHWMWFIFPQLKGLGRSETAEYFGISGLDEARAYLEHPTLGPRLYESTRAACRCGIRDAAILFGFPDNFKFRSSMTLFAEAARHSTLPEKRTAVFTHALKIFFNGEPDLATLQLLRPTR